MPHLDAPDHGPAARPLTPGEVLLLARGERPDGLPDDPRTRAIAGCRIGSGGWAAFDRAREEGFLVVVPIVGADEAAGLVRLWGWWCAAARRPEAVVRLRHGGGSGAADVEVDLSPARVRFAPGALAAIGRAWGGGVGGGRWLVSEETVQVAGLPVQDARGLVAGVLRLAADPRYVVREGGGTPPPGAA